MTGLREQHRAGRGVGRSVDVARIGMEKGVLGREESPGQGVAIDQGVERGLEGGGMNMRTIDTETIITIEMGTDIGGHVRRRGGDMSKEAGQESRKRADSVLGSFF